MFHGNACMLDVEQLRIPARHPGILFVNNSGTCRHRAGRFPRVELIEDLVSVFNHPWLALKAAMGATTFAALLTRFRRTLS
jgi:hypothetical protein